MGDQWTWGRGHLSTPTPKMDMKSGLQLLISIICWSFTQGINPPEQEEDKVDFDKVCEIVLEFFTTTAEMMPTSGSGTPNEVIEFIFEEWDGGESDEADNCISVEEFSAWVEDIKQSASEAEDRGNDDYGGEDSSTEEDFMWFFNQMSGGDECISREDLLNSMGAIEVCLEAMKQSNL